MSNRITTFEQACEALGIDPAKLPDFSMLSEQEAKAMLAHYKLCIIAKVLNGGWTPNWNNGKWDKYYPWFDMKNGFSFGFVNDRYRRSHFGSRLCFRDSETAEYAGTQFLDLYKEYFTIN